eukprot:5937815-Pyramimonas_sp.AAC.1
MASPAASGDLEVISLQLSIPGLPRACEHDYEFSLPFVIEVRRAEPDVPEGSDVGVAVMGGNLSDQIAEGAAKIVKDNIMQSLAVNGVKVLKPMAVIKERDDSARAGASQAQPEPADAAGAPSSSPMPTQYVDLNVPSPGGMTIGDRLKDYTPPSGGDVSPLGPTSHIEAGSDAAAPSASSAFHAVASPAAPDNDLARSCASASGQFGMHADAPSQELSNAKALGEYMA